VIADLKPYADYKDSCLPWLGQVPAHWRTVRNGSLFGQRSQTGYAELPILQVSLKTGVQVRSFGQAGRKQIMSDLGKYKRAGQGDLAYNTMRMWQGALGVCPVDGLVSPAYVVARPYPGVDARYFAALFRTGDYMAEIDNASRGIVKDRNRLYWDQFKQMQSPCPPPEEQAAIMRLLDWANGRLDQAIHAKRKVIALLTEQKQVVIHRAVTRGIDPAAPSKPSGVPWLGDIPAHWHLRRLKQVCRFAYGDSLPDAARRLGQVSVRGSNSQVGAHDVPNTQSPCIVIGRKGSFGKVNYCPEAVFAIDTTFYVDSRHTNADLQWLAHLLAIMRLDTVSKDAAVPGLSRDDAYSQFVPLPPSRSEQAQLANLLTRELHQFDGLSNRIKREIDLLREYRARLIADVVTGKLDVRAAAARMPEDVLLGTAEDLGGETDNTELTDEETEA
jgi:type I restriction enzyme S subunit